MQGYKGLYKVYIMVKPLMIYLKRKKLEITEQKKLDEIK